MSNPTSIYAQDIRRSGRDSYREIEDLMIGRLPFAGNSMSAHTNDAGQYVVLSYSTVIATVTCGRVEIAENRWSNTTGRHINICKRVLL